MTSFTTTALDDILCGYLKPIICEQNNLNPEDILSIKLDNGTVVVQLSGSVKQMNITFTVE